MNQSRPNSLKRRSPGSRPKPRRCSNGVNQLISTSARKMTMTQRIMETPVCPESASECVRAVAGAETAGIPEVAAVEGDHLEQFAHLVLGQQALRGDALRQLGVRHGLDQPAVDQEAPLAGVAE